MKASGYSQWGISVRGSQKEKDTEVEEDGNKLHIYIWGQYNEIHQTLFEREGTAEGRWEYDEGGELVQDMLYTCMELSQWNPFISMTNQKLN
jgi:hypothetical protein